MVMPQPLHLSGSDTPFVAPQRAFSPPFLDVQGVNPAHAAPYAVQQGNMSVGIASSSRFGERGCVLKRVLASGFHPGIGQVAGGEELRWRYQEQRKRLGNEGSRRIANPLFMGSNPISACSSAVGEVGWGPMAGQPAVRRSPAPVPATLGGSGGLMAASGVLDAASLTRRGAASADQRVPATSEIWTILSRKLLPLGAIARTLAITALARKASLSCE